MEKVLLGMLLGAFVVISGYVAGGAIQDTPRRPAATVTATTGLDSTAIYEYGSSVDGVLRSLDDSRFDLRELLARVKTTQGTVLLFKQLGKVSNRAAARINKITPPREVYRAPHVRLRMLMSRSARMYNQLAEAYRDYKPKRYGYLRIQVNEVVENGIKKTIAQLNNLLTHPPPP